MRKLLLAGLVWLLVFPFGDVAGQGDTAVKLGQRWLPLFAQIGAPGRFVLYGGSSTDSRTFVWEQGRWRVVADGPPARDDMVYAVVPHDQSILMFGGRGPAPGATLPSPHQAFRELWRFDGTRWTLLNSSGPEGRSHPAGAYDPRRRKLVVFGGRLGTSDEPGELEVATWEWDGSRWQRFDVPAPPGRMGHSMAFDPRSGLILLHGGRQGSISLTDTWGWNGERWQLLTMSGPLAEMTSAATIKDGGMVLFRGAPAAPNEPHTWYFSGTDWVRIESAGPVRRIFSAMANDPSTGAVYLLGGCAWVGEAGARRCEAQEDLWMLRPDRIWTRIY